VCCLSVAFASGYWRNEAATKETFTSDGWYRTGDVARVDNDGYW
jgi:long-subunit acyl-CoA synthetase (AMP-forming)